MFRDISGQKFGRWSVKDYSHRVKTRSYWNCVCECGTERKVWVSDLTRGSSESCGCLKNEKSAERLRKHDMSDHPAHISWRQARNRCRNSNYTGYKDYGGRGIKFSEKWDDFNKFWEDMGPTWFEGSSIDRIDVDGNYEPGNCQWSTPKEQANNRRNNKFLMCPDGVMRTIAESARAYGMIKETLAGRIRYGYPEEMLFVGYDKVETD